MNMNAPRKIMKVTAFFRKLNWVGSTFKFEDDSLMNRLIRDRRIFETTKAVTKVPTAMSEYCTIGRDSICSIEL